MLHIAAVANLFVALWIVRILPHDVYRARAALVFRPPSIGVQVHGLENYKAAGDRVVIVANHQSYLDACLIAAYLPDSPTFAIHTAQAAKWYFKPFLAAVETFPVDVPVALFGEAHGRGGARPRPQADDLPRGPHDAAPAG